MGKGKFGNTSLQPLLPARFGGPWSLRMLDRPETSQPLLEATQQGNKAQVTVPELRVWSAVVFDTTGP